MHPAQAPARPEGLPCNDPGTVRHSPTAHTVGAGAAVCVMSAPSPRSHLKPSITTSHAPLRQADLPAGSPPTTALKLLSMCISKCCRPAPGPPRMVGSGHGAQSPRLPQPGTFGAPSLPHVSRGALGAPPSPVSPSLLASPIATPPGRPNGSDAEDFEIHICISNSSRHLHVDGTDTSRSEGQSRTCHRPHTCTHMHTPPRHLHNCFHNELPHYPPHFSSRK